MPSTQQGLVLRIDAKVCHVEVDGQRRQLPLAGKLFEQRSHEKRPLAVGDRVELDATGQAIDALLPRRTQLHRRAASEGEERAQVVAANITRVLVVASIADPPLQPELVDGVLAAAAREGIPATLVLTKIDLDPPAAARWAAVYGHCGAAVVATSLAPEQRTEPELERLATLLHTNETVLCGLSGAGKSSLVNALVPGIALRTGHLNHIGQGRHTTTHTELLQLPGGGHVLDTPGVRNFHLFHAGPQELQFLFPELVAVRERCEYRNCLHDDEVGCAVRGAVAAAEIPATRFASYTRMLTDALAAEDPGAAKAPTRGGGRRRSRRR